MAELLNFKYFGKQPIPTQAAKRSFSQPKIIQTTFLTESSRPVKTPFSRPQTPKFRPKSPNNQIVIPDILRSISKQRNRKILDLQNFAPQVIQIQQKSKIKVLDENTEIGNFLIQRKLKRGAQNLVVKQKNNDMIPDQKQEMEPTILTSFMTGYGDEINQIIKQQRKGGFRRKNQ